MTRCTHEAPQCMHRVMEWGCTCARCSAAVFGPLVQEGVSIRTIANRARRAADLLEDISARSDVHALADTAEMLAAEAAMKGETE